jgi:hypothetical protein
MSDFFKHIIGVCLTLLVLGITSMNAAPQGFLEGRLKIVSRTPVEIEGENNARETTAVTAEMYASYPLVVLGRGERKQVARITADGNGSYRVSLPPGDYILDVEGRVRKRVHVRAQPFTIIANETVHVDMTVDAAFAAEGTAPQE